MSQPPDLSVEIAGIRFSNPVFAASGTFGYGEEFARFVDLNRIGAVVVKGTSVKPIEGNSPPCLFPRLRMLNSIDSERRCRCVYPRQDAVLRDKGSW
jgi:dihydroorotate dehydrogenase